MVNLNAFPLNNLVKILEIESIDVTFEKSVALAELMFEMISVTSRSQSLSVSVFLVANRACSSTSGASWID